MIGGFSNYTLLFIKFINFSVMDNSGYLFCFKNYCLKCVKFSIG